MPQRSPSVKVIEHAVVVPSEIERIPERTVLTQAAAMTEAVSIQSQGTCCFGVPMDKKRKQNEKDRQGRCGQLPPASERAQVMPPV
jgi:hypothetical protein